MPQPTRAEVRRLYEAAPIHGAPIFTLPQSVDPEVTALDLAIEKAFRSGDRRAVLELYLYSEAMVARAEVPR